MGSSDIQSDRPSARGPPVRNGPWFFTNRGRVHGRRVSRYALILTLLLPPKTTQHSATFHISAPAPRVYIYIYIIKLHLCFLGSLGTSVFDSNVFLVGASGGVYALLAAHLANVMLVST